MVFGEVQSGPKRETSAPVGIAVCLGVLGAVYAMGHRSTVSALYALFQMLVDRNPSLVWSGIGAAVFGLSFLGWQLGSALGVLKKDKSVDALREKSSGGRSGVKVRAIAVALLAGAGAYALLAYVWLPGELASLHIRGFYLHFLLERFFRAAFATLALVPGYVIGLMPIWNKLSELIPERLPKFPKPKNAIVLGSVGEQDLKRKASWWLIGLKGLVGNILITGSIGSGKSWGTIFSYIRQILSNFTLRPAVLAIDPKGKIARKIQEIAEELGIGEHVIHMKLGGDVTFNPIYQPSALKNGAFSDIAKMIRSAAVNYMGKSFDSPFWEQNASTLVKNCLIYCAATKNYYTLNDLYTALVRAVSNEDEFIKELEASLANGDFDHEEKKNIGFAIQYFSSEYRPLDDKVKTGILATSTTFLNQFQEYQASEIFCPDQEDLVIRSMDDIVNEGKILLLDITNDGLARSMGTFVKLHYEKALLNRMKQGRPTDRPGILIIDEYQDVVTTGYGADFGDEAFLAEGREANSITIAATQSLSALENAIGRAKATQVLASGFRTRILCHATDTATISSYQALAGKIERKHVSHSLSEHSREGVAGPGAGLSDRSSTSESVSTSEQKEDAVTAHDLATLSSYEAYAMLFDGVDATFTKLFLKPDYLKDKRWFHKKVVASMKPVFVSIALAVLSLGVLSPGNSAYAFPHVCTVLKTSESSSCMGFNVGACMCGWPIPRPCANFSYYIPQTFVEVMPNQKESFFGDLPGAAVQLGAAGANPVPYGAEADDDTQSFHSHVTSVPFTEIPFEAMPCGGAPVDRLCFEGMSEYLGSNWTTGSADSLQPNFLAWSLSPKGCLLKGAATSFGNDPTASYPATPACAVPMSWMPKYPPSSHSACSGWGTFFPRSGVYNGPSQTTGALMIAARMKSLSNEVFHTTPGSTDELWQMIYPQSSSCFREGQNVGVLDVAKNVREIGRLTSGRLKGHLFVVWSKVSCCRDLAEIPTAIAAIAAMSAVCQGMGNL